MKIGMTYTTLSRAEIKSSLSGLALCHEALTGVYEYLAPLAVREFSDSQLGKQSPTT